MQKSKILNIEKQIEGPGVRQIEGTEDMAGTISLGSCDSIILML